VKVWKMYNALKMLQVSIITLHLGFLAFMLEIYFFPLVLCLQQSSVEDVQDHLSNTVYIVQRHQVRNDHEPDEFCASESV